MTKPARVLVVGSRAQTASELQTAVMSMGFICNIVYGEAEILTAISEDPTFLLAVQVGNDEHVICHRPFPVARLVALCNSCKLSPAILGILPESSDILRQKCLSAGFADVMFSPISADTLYESICSLNHCRITESTQQPSQLYFPVSHVCTPAHEASSARDMPACNLDMGHDHRSTGASAPLHPALLHHTRVELMPDFMEINIAAVAPTADRTPVKRPAAAAFAECSSNPTSQRRRELVPCL